MPQERLQFVIEFDDKGSPVLRRFAGALGETEKAAGGLRVSLGRFSQLNIDAALNNMARAVHALQAAFSTGANVVNQFVSASAQIEGYKARLEGLTGSAAKAAATFERFKTIAFTTPFTLPDVVQAGITLKSFGQKNEDALKTVADLAAFMGTSIPEAASAYGRAFAAGAGAADIFRERGVLALIKLKSGVEDLTKLTIPQFRKAMNEVFSDPTSGISGSTDRLSKTFQGITSNLEDAIFKFKAKVGDSGLFDFVKATAQDLLETFQRLDDDGTLDSIAEKISTQLVSGLEQVVDLVKQIDVDRLLSVVQSLTEITLKLAALATSEPVVVTLQILAKMPDWLASALEFGADAYDSLPGFLQPGLSGVKPRNGFGGGRFRPYEASGGGVGRSWADIPLPGILTNPEAGFGTVLEPAPYVLGDMKIPGMYIGPDAPDPEKTDGGKGGKDPLKATKEKLKDLRDEVELLRRGLPEFEQSILESARAFGVLSAEAEPLLREKALRAIFQDLDAEIAKANDELTKMSDPLRSIQVDVDAFIRGLGLVGKEAEAVRPKVERLFDLRAQREASALTKDYQNRLEELINPASAVTHELENALDKAHAVAGTDLDPLITQFFQLRGQMDAFNTVFGSVQGSFETLFDAFTSGTRDFASALEGLKGVALDFAKEVAGALLKAAALRMLFGIPVSTSLQGAGGVLGGILTLAGGGGGGSLGVPVAGALNAPGSRGAGILGIGANLLGAVSSSGGGGGGGSFGGGPFGLATTGLSLLSSGYSAITGNSLLTGAAGLLGIGGAAAGGFAATGASAATALGTGAVLANTGLIVPGVASTGVLTSGGVPAGAVAGAGAGLGAAAAAGGIAAAVIGAILNSYTYNNMVGAVNGRTTVHGGGPFGGIATSGVPPVVGSAMLLANGDTTAGILSLLMPQLFQFQAAGIDVLGIEPDRSDYQIELIGGLAETLLSRKVGGAGDFNRRLGSIKGGEGVGNLDDISSQALAFGAAIAGLRGGGGSTVFAGQVGRAADDSDLDIVKAFQALGLSAPKAIDNINRSFDGGMRQAESYKKAVQGVIEAFTGLPEGAAKRIRDLTLLGDDKTTNLEMKVVMRASRAARGIVQDAFRSSGGDMASFAGSLAEGAGSQITEALGKGFFGRGGPLEGLITEPVAATRLATRRARRMKSPGGREITPDELEDITEAALAGTADIAARLGENAGLLRQANEVGLKFTVSLAEAAGDYETAAKAQTTLARSALAAGEDPTALLAAAAENLRKAQQIALETDTVIKEAMGDLAGAASDFLAAAGADTARTGTLSGVSRMNIARAARLQGRQAAADFQVTTELQRRLGDNAGLSSSYLAESTRQFNLGLEKAGKGLALLAGVTAQIADDQQFVQDLFVNIGRAVQRGDTGQTAARRLIEGRLAPFRATVEAAREFNIGLDERAEGLLATNGVQRARVGIVATNRRLLAAEADLSRYMGGGSLEEIARRLRSTPSPDELGGVDPARGLELLQRFTALQFQSLQSQLDLATQLRDSFEAIKDSFKGVRENIDVLRRGPRAQRDILSRRRDELASLLGVATGPEGEARDKALGRIGQITPEILGLAQELFGPGSAQFREVLDQVDSASALLVDFAARNEAIQVAAIDRVRDAVTEMSDKLGPLQIMGTYFERQANLDLKAEFDRIYTVLGGGAGSWLQTVLNDIRDSFPARTPPAQSYGPGGGRQYGGLVMPGRMYDVNEAGREGYVPADIGYVTPAGKMGLSVSVPITTGPIVVGGHGGDTRALAKDVAEALRAHVAPELRVQVEQIVKTVLQQVRR